MVRWRGAAVDDPAAQSLLAEYFASRAASFPSSQGEYRAVFPSAESFTPPHGIFLIAKKDAVDVGCGGIRRIDLAGGDVTFEIKHLWLRPAARGHGAGRALLQELERRAVDLGAARLVLDTNASLTAASGLYRSSGFVEIEPYNVNPNATTWFEKRLPRSK